MLKQLAHNPPHRHTAKQPLIRMSSVHCHRGAPLNPAQALGAPALIVLLRHVCWGLRERFLALVVVVLVLGDEGFDLVEGFVEEFLGVAVGARGGWGGGEGGC